MKDHIINESIATEDGILDRCMYCNDNFGKEDVWFVKPEFFNNYIGVKCTSCNHEHRFKDPNIHNLEDLIERMAKKRK